MTAKRFVRHQRMKNETSFEVLRALAAGAVSKRAIQAHTGLSWGAICQNINRLEEREVIQTAAPPPRPEGTVRRPTAAYRFPADRLLCMGMELHRDRILTALVDLGGERRFAMVCTPAAPLTMEHAAAAIQAAWTQTLAACALPATAVAALSFSLTGAVDENRRVWVRSSHVPTIQNLAFEPILTDFPELLCWGVEHDILAKARAVCRCRGWDDDYFVFTHFGAGIGLIAHQPHGFLTGAHGQAGEIGHIPVVPVEGTPRCLEHELSVDRLLAAAREQCGLAAADMTELTRLATPAQLARLYDWMQPWLLQAATVAVNLFDPGVLIMGGELLEPFLAHLPRDFTERLRQISWQGHPAEVRVYAMSECDSAFGSALRLGEPVMRILADRLNQ